MSQPTSQAEFVEMIVREVIRRLREQGVAVTTSTETAGATTVVAPAMTAKSELKLADKLVTLETLRNRLAGVKRLSVAKKAIVTPAVKDELKKQRIELVRI